MLAAVGLAGFALSASGQGASGADVGVVAHSTGEVDEVAATGAGWVQLTSSWARLEPVNGMYSVPRWDALDALVSHAKSLGLHVELTLTGAPDWATGATGTGVPPQPAFYGRYAKFLGDLAHRLGPKVDAWVAWNEPNHPNYWSTPDPVAFAHLQQAAYPAIKAADPSSTVLLAPIAPTGPGLYGNPGSGSINPYNYLQSLYDNGIRGYYDAVAWNLYPPGAPEDAFPDSSGRPYAGSFPGQLYVHSLIQANDPGKHVWITEFGWSTCSGCQQNLVNGTDEATQADYLSRAWTYERRYLPWVDVMFWFEATDGNSPSTWERGLGLIRSDGSHKPSYQALTAVANQSGGSSGGGGGGGGTGTTRRRERRRRRLETAEGEGVHRAVGRALEGQGRAQRRSLHPEAPPRLLQPQLRRRHQVEEDGSRRRRSAWGQMAQRDHRETEAELEAPPQGARPRVHDDPRPRELGPGARVPQQGSRRREALSVERVTRPSRAS